MRYGLIGLVAMLSASAVTAQVHVKGYTTKNGTYVAPHYRSAPDHSVYNNWSTVGNVNPYTGQPGTKNPYSSYGTPNTYSNPYSSYSRPNYSSPSYGCSYCSQNQSGQDDGSDPN